MKTLLILGAGLDQILGIKKAREMGIYTIALDGNHNASGKEYADEFYTVSIKHIEQIENFINTKLTKKIDGVIAFGVDIPYIITQTAELLGVNYTINLASAKISEDKFESKEFMKKNSIPIPSYKLVKNINDIKNFTKEYGFPIILKPVDNSAARGISFIQNLENIEKYYDYALEFSKQKKVLVEKYLEGPQISTESFVIDGKIYNIGFSDRNYDDMEKFLPNIIENGGDLPSLYLKERHRNELEEALFSIAKKLNIKNGVIKGDIVIHNDKLHIIEFALRLSGGNFSTVEIPESTGVDFIKIAIKLHMNMKVSENELNQTKNDFVSLRYKFVNEEYSGIIKGIKKANLNRNIILSALHVNTGDKVDSKTTDHSKRLGFALAKGKNREEAILNAENYLKKVEIIFE